MIAGAQVHLVVNKEHTWMQLPTQEGPEIARLGSWKEQESGTQPLFSTNSSSRQAEVASRHVLARWTQEDLWAQLHFAGS